MTVKENAFDARYQGYLERIEEHLRSLFAGKPDWADLHEAMRYSLLAGGKRVRPVLTLEFARISGLGDHWDGALWAACALELVHTYSLIHDDLPCMDNDDLRRGKPTNHKVYGETMAVLAGDALQPAAYEHILSCQTLNQAQRLECALLLAEASGPQGMVAGQVLDTLHMPGTEAELLQVHSLKTGAMFRAACGMGCACGGANDAALRKAARVYAENIGLAFQIRDDMLDVESTAEVLGKTIGSDADNGKTTFASLYGLEKCAELVAEHTRLAQESITGVFRDTEFLCALAQSLAVRKN